MSIMEEIGSKKDCSSFKGNCKRENVIIKEKIPHVIFF